MRKGMKQRVLVHTLSLGVNDINHRIIFEASGSPLI